jgi:hypothetical protein
VAVNSVPSGSVAVTVAPGSAWPLSCVPAALMLAVGARGGVTSPLWIDGVTWMSKTSLKVAVWLSVAVTLTCSVPRLLKLGVPLKVRVRASKASQSGSALPSAKVAL